jgi:hypothetical protein
LNVDVAIATAGSKSFVPDIPGVDREKALTVMDMYYNTERISDTTSLWPGAER